MRNELTRHLEPVVTEAGLFLEGVSVSPAGRRTVVCLRHRRIRGRRFIARVCLRPLIHTTNSP